MKNKIVEFKNFIKTKKIALVGLGITNTSLMNYLVSIGANVTVFENAPMEKIIKTYRQFKGYKINFEFGEEYLKKLHGFDIIFRSPGFRFDIPEFIEAKKEGTIISSEMEVFFELCPAPIFAVTGSDGKTTTTMLIYNILKEYGYKCWLGGNMGIPILDKVESIKEDDKVILELSSFHLHTMNRSPNVAIITNISPNHLDVHKSMNEYIEAKKNIIKYQNLNDKTILNYDNLLTRELGNETNNKVLYFSRKSNIDNGLLIKNNKIVYKNNGVEINVLDVDNIKIPGVHNIENYMAAIGAVIDYVNPDAIQKVASTFNGVEHRNEFVGEVNGVKFYNDSIGTSPTRTMATLNSFKNKVILIAGGYDKKISYEDMGDTLYEKVKYLVLIGKTSDKIEQSLKSACARQDRINKIPIVKCGKFEDAVKIAYKNATKGDVILLSPASSSFDMFKNFEERGNIYKTIVNNLNQ